MGINANPDLLKWFAEEYTNYSKAKLDMRKSCIRWEKPKEIPYELIEKLAKKITPKRWIEFYQKNFKA